LNSCPPRAELLLALDGELTPPEQHALATHLRHCPICSGTLGDVERVMADVDVSAGDAAAAEARRIEALARKQRFMARLDGVRQQHMARRAAGPIQRSLMSVASAAMAAFTFIGSGRRRR
jgi:anti-sigma factor RsiW